MPEGFLAFFIFIRKELNFTVAFKRTIHIKLKPSFTNIRFSFSGVH